MNLAGYCQGTHEHLPEEQRKAQRSAIRLQIVTVVYTVVTIVLVVLVMGSSQAMKTAWIEDMLSLLPQLAFFIALFFIRKPSSVRHPYGQHRAMGIGHLVAGVALLTVGASLVVQSSISLITAEHPTIGTVTLFGEAVWLGWLMIAVMAVTAVGPPILGRMKAKVAAKLHNKVLFADADMMKADWHTNIATILGVFGVGIGLWWLDATAAIVISVGIIADGLRNTKSALADLMDRRARTYDGEEPHPVTRSVLRVARDATWAQEAGVRVRDQGQVLHIELFVVPALNHVELEWFGPLIDAVRDIDWKIHDVVIVPTDPLPPYADTDKQVSRGRP
ncbi:cation transporter [uncultured Agrococcus sp.]|uniref:cation diffusion facilitator family transporter n=1 Tax=uncultured Agrococcus sp. TaxID=382258 RepID=UPI0025DF14EE|nr:cation transporter [uncultured Agrococcus sp.]